MSKKKVLIVTEAVSYGGNNMVAMNIEKHLDKEKFECTYCVRRDTIGAFEQEILDRGVRVIHVPDSELSYIKSYKFYYNLLKNEHFDIVHSHLLFISGLLLYAAKKCNVPIRIAHAHFSQPYTDTAIYSKPKQFIAFFYRIIMRVLLKYFCNNKIACSQDSGKFLFGKREFDKNGIIIPNGIDTSVFAYDEVSRKQVRDELNIPSDACVLGHIGQMYSVKNQSFILDIFKNFLQSNCDSYLLLVGDGVDRNELESKTKRLGLEDRVLFLGNRNDVSRLYHAMDCFVFPSLHEGFPITLIEAQASKLSCVVSSNVTNECIINTNYSVCSLYDSVSTWANTISLLTENTDRESININNLICIFDINKVVNRIKRIYDN